MTLQAAFAYNQAAASPTVVAAPTVSNPTIVNAVASGASQSNSPSAGVGYAPGAGGAVTQGTSKSTGVTLNKPTGQITMHNAALASGATVGFTLTNTTIKATDLPDVAIASGGTANSYDCGVDAVADGSCHIWVTNKSGGSLGEALVLNFANMRGVAA